MICVLLFFAWTSLWTLLRQPSINVLVVILIFFFLNECFHFYVVDAVCDVGIKGNLLLITMGPFDKIILSHSPLPSFFP